MSVGVDSLGRRNPGRAPQLTGRLEYGLCSLVAQGLTVRGAALGLGLAPRTVERWCELGRTANGHPNAATYRQLLDSLDAARCERAAHIAEVVEQARRDAGA